MMEDMKRENPNFGSEGPSGDSDDEAGLPPLEEPEETPAE